MEEWGGEELPVSLLGVVAFWHYDNCDKTGRVSTILCGSLLLLVVVENGLMYVIIVCAPGKEGMK